MVLPQRPVQPAGIQYLHTGVEHARAQHAGVHAEQTGLHQLPRLAAQQVDGRRVGVLDPEVAYRTISTCGAGWRLARSTNAGIGNNSTAGTAPAPPAGRPGGLSSSGSHPHSPSTLRTGRGIVLAKLGLDHRELSLLWVGEHGWPPSGRCARSADVRTNRCRRAPSWCDSNVPAHPQPILESIRADGRAVPVSDPAPSADRTNGGKSATGSLPTVGN